MRLMPRLFAVIAACAFFPAAHAACTPASIAGWFAAGSAGAFYGNPDLIVGVGRVGFNGVNGVSITDWRQGQEGTVSTFTGSGTYTIDAWCRGTATVALKQQNGASAGTMTMSFVVSGTPTSPRITGLVSHQVNAFTATVQLDKIGL